MAARKSILISCVCEICGATFTVKEWRLKRLKVQSTPLCSKRCSNIFKSQKPLANRFWEKVFKTDGCWIWTGTLNDSGYGILDTNSGKRMTRAHRISWEINYGPIPDGLCVLHKCDVPACCRPDHLFLGTQADNNRDMIKKDRHARGERATGVKLTDAQVLSIRAHYAQGFSVRQLAKENGVKIMAIYKILSGIRWKHLLPAEPSIDDLF